MCYVVCICIGCVCVCVLDVDVCARGFNDMGELIITSL